MRIFPSGLVLAFLVMGLTACATNETTTGQPILQPNVDRIVDGQTTGNQVISMFGAPDKTTEMGPDTLYTYQYTVTDTSMGFFYFFTKAKTQVMTDKLTITFDKSNIVKAHNMQRGVTS